MRAWHWSGPGGEGRDGEGAMVASRPAQWGCSVQWTPADTPWIRAGTVVPVTEDRALVFAIEHMPGSVVQIGAGILNDPSIRMGALLPIWQTDGAPLRSTWWAAAQRTGPRGWLGRLSAHWSPGSAPRVALMGVQGPWSVSMGSGGVRMHRAWKMRSAQGWWLLGLGWLRGGVPLTKGSFSTAPLGARDESSLGMPWPVAQ